MYSRTIMLIEDNHNDIALTRRALMKNNVINELIIVRDGQEALDYLFGENSHSGRDISLQPALILLDLKIPLVDGLSVLRQIKGDARTKRIPVVVLTTSDEGRDMEAAYSLGVNSYIRKPVNFNHFTEAIRTLGLYWMLTNEPPPRGKVM